MSKKEEKQNTFPPQHQDQQPGIESEMDPLPVFDNPDYRGSEKLKSKVAIITGGDSGIGRAVAVSFAKEGAKLCLVYLDEDSDMQETANALEKYATKFIAIKGDIGSSEFCEMVVRKTFEHFGSIDILINNAAEQHPKESIEEITDQQLAHTFQTNIFSQFYLVRSSLPFLKPGACIVNTASVTAYRGSEGLLDYSSTKGAIVSFTRSLSASLAERNIRVNAVAPGPIWTPLIPSTFSEEKVSSFGSDVPMRRAGQPYEVASCFVFLASEDSSYMTGQVLHPNGGELING